MKIEDVNQEFTPIVLTITIESEQELCDLWLRMNKNAKSINDSNGYVKHEASDINDNFWLVLERYISKLNLNK